MKVRTLSRAIFSGSLQRAMNRFIAATHASLVKSFQFYDNSFHCETNGNSYVVVTLSFVKIGLATSRLVTWNGVDAVTLSAGKSAISW